MPRSSWRTQLKERGNPSCQSRTLFKAGDHEPAAPTTIAEWLEVEIYRLRMKQEQFAQLLGISESRLSKVINSRRAPNLDLVKRLHTTLHVPGDKLLKLV